MTDLDLFPERPTQERPVPADQSIYAPILDASSETLRAVLENVSGGYSGALRGILTTEDGERLFVKRGVSIGTIRACQREVEVLEILQSAGFSSLPKLLGANETTLVQEDLSGRDFSDIWTPEKLVAAFEAMDELASIRPDERLGRFSIVNGWDLMAKQPELMKALRDLMGEDFDESIDESLEARALAAEMFLDSPGVVSHGDAHADNFAYDPVTETGKFIDWNWCGIAPPSMDTTELLVSVARSGYPLPEGLILEKCSAEACQMLAGYWFSQCTQPAWEGGENIRAYQYESALIAWDWHRLLSYQSGLHD